jgi:hypothetical protein
LFSSRPGAKRRRPRASFGRGARPDPAPALGSSGWHELHHRGIGAGNRGGGRAGPCGAVRSLGKAGFEGGDVVLFSSTAEPPSAEFALIGNSGLIFESPDAASEALEAHRTIGVPNLTLNAVDYPAEQIGDESYVFTFSAGPAGVAGAVCVFRLGNTLFIVAGSGEPVTADDLVALARIVAGRATG